MPCENMEPESFDCCFIVIVLCLEPESAAQGIVFWAIIPVPTPFIVFALPGVPSCFQGGDRQRMSAREIKKPPNHYICT